MNVAGLLLLFVVIIAAVFGGILIASKTNTAPYQDSYGTFAGNSTNTSLSQVQNLSVVAPKVGTGAALLVGGIIAVAILLGLVLVAGSPHLLMVT